MKKIAIVGKGGSGKSTVSWLLSRYFGANGCRVLALDADYNTDLASALIPGLDLDDPAAEILAGLKLAEPEAGIPLLNQSEPDFYSFLDLADDLYYVDIPLLDGLKRFSSVIPDAFTKKYLLHVTDTIRLLISGPNNPEMLYGHRCPHAYVSPIKYFIPLLDLGDNEILIADSVAGTDMVQYGLYLGADAMISVVEQTPQSIRVHRQIATIAAQLGIPLFVIINEKQKSVQREIELDNVIGTIPSDPALLAQDYENLSAETLEAVGAIMDKVLSIQLDPELQWSRHIQWRELYKPPTKRWLRVTRAFLQKVRLLRVK